MILNQCVVHSVKKTGHLEQTVKFAKAKNDAIKQNIYWKHNKRKFITMI